MGLKRQFRMPTIISIGGSIIVYAIKPYIIMLMNNTFFRNRADYDQIYFLSEITLREIILINEKEMLL